MEAIKTPNDMSDKNKTELFLEKWFPENTPNDDYDKNTLIASWDDCEEMLESYAEQHLEDVLEKMEKRLDEMTTDRETGLDWICGYQKALNLLKQRTNGN